MQVIRIIRDQKYKYNKFQIFWSWWILQCNVTFSVQGESFSAFGIIGIQGQSYAEVKNLRTSVSVNSISQPPQDTSIGIIVVGIVFGSVWAKNCTIQNTTVIGGNIVSSKCNCGIFGILFYNTTIINSSISYTNISGCNVGGIIGWQFEERGETIIRDSAISNMNIFGSLLTLLTVLNKPNARIYQTTGPQTGAE
ncbi:Hypothetical_protein [Hexamita inflata]|uniref:Hypothetical_protein n=1 Tax=Hexamita inflata TaxID=28002 RepID=A0AA86Q5A8_9EUKA|nr:Hypothetical protein HINF_LOCUS40309 [Hexamita inflata]